MCRSGRIELTSVRGISVLEELSSEELESPV